MSRLIFLDASFCIVPYVLNFTSPSSHTFSTRAGKRKCLHLTRSQSFCPPQHYPCTYFHFVRLASRVHDRSTVQQHGIEVYKAGPEAMRIVRTNSKTTQHFQVAIRAALDRFDGHLLFNRDFSENNFIPTETILAIQNRSTS